MERCEKYKDSGVEWIGAIPVGWGVCQKKADEPGCVQKVMLSADFAGNMLKKENICIFLMIILN